MHATLHTRNGDFDGRWTMLRIASVGLWQERAAIYRLPCNDTKMAAADDFPVAFMPNETLIFGA
jgi:hypothetical protein